MAGENNVVEIRLRAIDEFNATFSKLGSTLRGLRTVAAAVLGGFSIGALVRNINEAQEAAAKLDATFRATGAGLGLTRNQLDDLASELQRTTTFSDDAVKSAEALLLTFDKVRGDAFEQTIRAATDLSALLGTDLTSATRLLGRALQDPARGLDALRRAGVVFTGQQREIVKSLVESGDALEAQRFILGEVERRYGGTAAALRNTLGGALKGLSNTVSDLFEGPGAMPNLVRVINDVAKALDNPELRKNLDSFITALGRIAELGLKAAGAVGGLLNVFGAFDQVDSLVSQIKERRNALNNLIPTSQDYIRIQKELLELERELQKVTGRRSGPDRRGRGGIGLVDEDQFSGLDEITVIARRIQEAVQDPQAEFLAELERATQTSLERQLQDWEGFEADLKLLLANGVITAEEAAKRRAEKTEEILPEIEVTARRMLPQIKETLDAVSEATREATRDIQSSFTELFLSLGSGTDNFAQQFIDAIRRMLANIAAAIAVQALGIEKLLGDLGKSIGGSGSSGGGGLQAIGGFIASLFGGRASGGLGSGLELVGEEGPELVDLTRGKVFNRRQLAFAGGGAASVVFNGPNVTIVARESDADALRAEFYGFMAVNNQRQSREVSRLLSENGMGRPR